MSFEKHKTKNEDKTSVWSHFLVDKSGASQAQCIKCKKILKTNGGSTKGLLTHLNVSHLNIEI